MQLGATREGCSRDISFVAIVVLRSSCGCVFGAFVFVLVFFYARVQRVPDPLWWRVLCGRCLAVL